MITIVDTPEMTVKVKDIETKKWYFKSWPNKNGMELADRQLISEGMAERETIKRDGQIVGYIFLVN